MPESVEGFEVVVRSAPPVRKLAAWEAPQLRREQHAVVDEPRPLQLIDRQ